MSFLYIVSLPFSFPRNMPLFQEVLSFYSRVCQGTAKLWRSPYAILSQGEYSLSIALLYSLCRNSVAISTAMAAGLALVSSIQMARKPPIGTNYRQELSYAPLLLPDRDCRPFRSCRLSRGRVKRLIAPCRINSSVFSLCQNEALYVVNYRQTSALYETPLLAYTLPL